MNQAKIMMLMFVCIMYSGGMPFLYPLCLCILLINYWYNKYMLLKYCQRNQTFNEALIINSYSVLKWSFVAHFFMTLKMFERSETLRFRKIESKHFNNVIDVGYDAMKLSTYPEYLKVYFEYLAVVIVLYCINLFIINPVTCFFEEVVEQF